MEKERGASAVTSRVSEKYTARGHLGWTSAVFAALTITPTVASSFARPLLAVSVTLTFYTDTASTPDSRGWWSTDETELRDTEDLAKVPFQVQATTVQAAPPLALSLTSCAQQILAAFPLSAGPPYGRDDSFPSVIECLSASEHWEPV